MGSAGMPRGGGEGLALKPACDQLAFSLTKPHQVCGGGNGVLQVTALACPFGQAASIQTGSGARCQVCSDDFVNISPPSLHLNSFFLFCQFKLLYMALYQGGRCFFIFPTSFFHSYQIKLVMIIANIC